MPALRCTGQIENSLRRQGYLRPAGVDEAGRGCLFGPVYASAVVLDPDRPISGLNDSKQARTGDAPRSRKRGSPQVRLLGGRRRQPR